MNLKIAGYITRRIARMAWVLVAIMGIQLAISLAEPSHKMSQSASIPPLNSDFAANNQHSID